MATSMDMSKRKNWVPDMPGIANSPISRYDIDDGNVSSGSPRSPYPPSPPIDYDLSMTEGEYPPSTDYNTPPRNRRGASIVSPPSLIPRVNVAHLIGAHGQEDSAFHQDATYSNQEYTDDVPCRDFFFDSDKVLSLYDKNFTTFLSRKDVTLVMFYNDRYPETAEFQKVFSEAASNTKRENHAFAGVDCVANPSLCSTNGICKVPVMRLYSRNYCIGEMKTVHNLSSEILRQYVEMAPVSDCTRMVKCTRPVR